ncbi:unnamed protein product [Blepharisma stoltei]|uniref:Membrane transporter protein n=1 Tax=Blepharisma stoltei TaxID=1481888 RepID=A0AAU9IBB9_9CILI|nr:unnamed protein product [Blepharisma stoltei]
MILFILGFAIIGSLIKGGRDSESILGFSQCSSWYWAFVAIFFISLLILCFVAELLAIHKVNRKIEQGYNFDDHDIKWNIKNTSLLSAFTIIAGITASLLGLGGGLVMNPIMLNIGYRPEVSTASSSFLVLMASIIAVLQFSLAGEVILAYGLWLFFTSVLGSMLGTFFILKTAKRYKRVSIVVLILSVILFMCIIAIPTYGIIDMATGGDTQYGFSGFC